MERRPLSRDVVPKLVNGVHQFVADLSAGRAFVAHLVAVREAVRSLGLASEIFVAHEPPGAASGDGWVTRAECAALPLGAFPPMAYGSVMLYHAFPGREMVEYVMRRGEPLLIWHYGLFPPDLWCPWDGQFAGAIADAPADLRVLGGRCLLGLATSPEAEGELVGLGCLSTTVVPPLVPVVDDAEYKGRAVEGRRSVRGAAAWLAVANLSPEQRHHDLIAALAAYRRAYDPAARLRIVGMPVCPGYAETLTLLSSRLGLEGAVEIVHDDPAPGGLGRYMARADILVALGQRGATGAAILAAFGHGLPVVATGEGATGVFVGAAGLRIPPAPPSQVAAAVRRVLSDASLRGGLMGAGRRCAGERSAARARGLFIGAVRQITGRWSDGSADASAPPAGVRAEPGTEAA